MAKGGKEGFYAVTFGGAAGGGFGMVVLDTNLIVGADVTGVLYDGTYEYNARTDRLDVHIVVTVPPGVWLVQGVPSAPKEYKFPIEASLPRDLGAEMPTDVSTPFGSVKAIFKKVRNFPN
jgi:hypothetical protein